MIGRLRGVIADRLPDGSVIVDVGGVGYEVFVPLGTLGKLPAAPESVTLHVHTHVREDALSLYGFARAEDRAAFRTLLGISNVGPKLAIAILSSMDARQLASAVANRDKNRFQNIPGVGKRTAERLLLELEDKLGFVSPAATLPKDNGKVGPAPSAGDDKLLATVADLLVGMGFKPSEAERAVAAVAGATEGESVQSLTKKALAQLG